MHIDFQQTPAARDAELAAIRTFLVKHVDAREGGALYCQGQPGTGKTLCMRHVLGTLEERVASNMSLPTVVFINCLDLERG